jgi:benzodiazapine receptor
MMFNRRDCVAGLSSEVGYDLWACIGGAAIIIAPRSRGTKDQVDGLTLHVSEESGMHILNGKSNRAARAGREAFEAEIAHESHPATQIALGALLAGGAILAALAMGRRHEAVLDDEMYAVEFAEMHEPVAHQPKPLTSLILPPLFIAMTLSGLRTWNAPASPARTRALTMWSLTQGFNALWLGLGAKRLGGQATAATASLAASTAYAIEARKVGGGTAPDLGWLGVANALTDAAVAASDESGRRSLGPIDQRRGPRPEPLEGRGFRSRRASSSGSPNDTPTRNTAPAVSQKARAPILRASTQAKTSSATADTITSQPKNAPILGPGDREGVNQLERQAIFNSRSRLNLPPPLAMISSRSPAQDRWVLQASG